ncbi:PBSX family phage terminase large subunit [Advenella sp. EE-W14]|uniref:PBSX family phage terminase large subunit n=1 Tax=Advenella sp. EE-W14 TaxID=2722705 RepID=UPI00145CCA14|nr:PBSX family phage terminase large subunit [Advenella sp. EE-W14]
MASLNPNLLDFWFKDGIASDKNFRKARHRVLYGGRASSKSWEFAGQAAGIANRCMLRMLCVRRYQNKIKESVYTLIASQIENFGFKGFDIRASDIKHKNGSEFVFYGIERNTDEIKSFEGADILWIEEAHNLTKEQWEILKPTIRKEGSEIWLSFNPKLASDFVYQRFVVNPPASTIIRLINYTENPFISKTALADIEDLKQEDYETYEHVYLGVPKTDDEFAIIKRSWVEAAVDAHLKLGIDLSGARTVGYDVADSGEDKNATTVFDGAIAREIDEWKAPEDELVTSALRAWGKVGNGRLVYDSIGVGAHVGSTLKEKKIYSRYYKFNAAGAVVNPDKEYAPKITNAEKFENLKAQAWQDVADRLRNTFNAVNKGMKYPESELISISSEIKLLERLKTELCTPNKSISKRGLDMVESKQDLRKREIKSPNLADSFVMGACPHLAVDSKLDRFLTMAE